MSEKIVEETVFQLKELKVAIGVLKRFCPCSDGELTTFRLTFKYMKEKQKTIFVSSIRSVKLSNNFFQEYLVVRVGTVSYFMSCSDNRGFYSELNRVIRLSDMSTVLNNSQSLGGISRVISSQREKVEETKGFQEAIKDLETLKKKAPAVLEVLLKLNKYDRDTFKRSIEEVFRNLGVEDIFSLPQEPCDKEHLDHLRKVLSLFLSKNDAILLHELYCASNRLSLSNLITPHQLMQLVGLLEREGVCKIHKINEVYLLTRETTSDLERDFCKDLVVHLKRGPTDATSFAREKNITPGLARVKLKVAEELGLAVRDDSLEQTSHYYNHFNSYLIY